MSWAFLFYGILLSYLLIISVIDIHHQIIPDELSLSGIPLGLLAAWLINDITWWESLLGIGFGGAIFWGVALLYEKITKREGLGGGDVKLLAMLGAWLGYQSILPIIIISSALGTVFGLSLMLIKKKNFKMAIPFGPFLAAAAVIFLFAKEPILTLIFSTEK
jgi:leader peptidase (prepilin peptidase)/N-methyltransferase